MTFASLSITKLLFQILIAFIIHSAAFINNQALHNQRSRRRLLCRTKLDDLKRAGDCITSISKTVPNDDCSPHFQSAGEALCLAHNGWKVDWVDVTNAFGDASNSFLKLSTTTKGTRAGELYELIAQELQDASNIQGCTSIGPPSSVPNLEAISESLTALANLEEKLPFSDLLSEASDAILSLMEDVE